MSPGSRVRTQNPGNYRYALAVTSQFYFCGVPFRLDVMPKCPLNCLYCFAMSRGGRRTSTALAADAGSLVRRLTRGLLLTQDRISVESEMIQRNLPLHVGGIGDPFSNSRAAAVSWQVLRFLHEASYPTVISTKNPKALLDNADRDDVRLGRGMVVQVSFTTLDDSSADRLEPRAPSPRERIECVRLLADRGVFVVARIQPLIEPYKAHVVRELIPALADAGCSHAVVEHLKLPVERRSSLIGEFLEAVGWDAYGDYCRAGATLVGREWILPSRVSWDSLQPVIESIHRGKMTFGAADYGLYHLGDTACCCGIDGLGEFKHWFKGNFSNVIRETPQGVVSFSSVQRHWQPKSSIREVMNSHCRSPGASSVLDYLRLKWNRPNSPNAPDAYLGIRSLGDRDENGDCLYIKEEVA
jgi:DNA repair photolyase